jgi:hypothetical protein
MMRRATAIAGLMALLVTGAGVSLLRAQAGDETFTATAVVKTAGGATATAPVRIVVSRRMSQAEADRFTDTFTKGGAAALRKALVGVPPTGSVAIGNGSPTPTRLTLERITDRGRLLTIVADQPMLFLGAGLPGAKPKAGFDFAVVTLEVDAAGGGSGTLAPAATVRVNNGAFVVDDYGAETIRLEQVKKAKQDRP